MTNDRYVKACLTVIAVALCVNAARGWLAIPEAAAAVSGETVKCQIVGDVNVTGKIGIDTFGNPVVVKASDEMPIRIDRDVPVKIDDTVRVHNN